MKDRFLSATARQGMEQAFRFSGTNFKLTAYEDNEGRLAGVQLVCANATPAFQRVLENDNDVFSNSFRMGLSCSELIDGFRFHKDDRRYPVGGAGNVKSAITIWHAALQILEKKYGADTSQVHFEKRTRGHLKVFDGGMA